MVTQKARVTTNPIVWALAIVLVMVAGGYTYSIVSRCQTSTFEAVKIMTISMGQCEAPTPSAKDAVQPAPMPSSSPAVKVLRSEMPCRWAWVWLGNYSQAKGAYTAGPFFKFSTERGPGSPFPNKGDKIVMTADRTLLISGYAEAQQDAKCNRVLEPPRGYDGYKPKIAKNYEAGTLKRNTEVAIDRIVLLPEASSDPTYAWALVGPEL